MVLRAKSAGKTCAGHEAGSKLSAAHRLSVANRGGDRVRDPCGSGDELVLRQDRGTAAEVCVVCQELAWTGVASGQSETERPEIMRRTWQCVDLVSGGIH